MNLLFLNSVNEKTYGGMEEWIRLAASGLAKRGHSLTICGRKKSEFLRRLKNLEPDLEICELEISGDFNLFTISRLKDIIVQNKIDKLIVNFNKDIRLGGLAAKFANNVKVVWSVGLDITKDNFIHKHLTPMLIDSVIVPSHSLKVQITRHGYIEPSTVTVIPIGIPEVTLTVPKERAREQLLKKFNLPDDCVIAVTCGGLVEQKGHEYLIQAAPQIVKKYPNVYFLFLGDGPRRSKLESGIAELGLKSHFVFAGMVDDVAALLSACDLMIHPSIEEPFGIAILEGMRAGLPIIASRVGGIPEVIRENETGLLVEPKNPDAIAAAVISLTGQGLQFNQMGQGGTKRWKMQFSYDLMIERIENYLGGQPAEIREYGKAQADRT